MKARLYLETTIPSYLVARPSRDLRLAADQQITRDWWDRSSGSFELFTSDVVVREALRGDAEMAAARLSYLGAATVLVSNEIALELASKIGRPASDSRCCLR